MIQPELQSEDRLLAAAWQWAWNHHPATRRCLFHVPNELDRLPGETRQNHIRRLSQAKAKGVVPGVADLILLWQEKGYVFEFKTATGTLSEAQLDFRNAMIGQQIPHYLVRSVEEFQILFNSIIKP